MKRSNAASRLMLFAAVVAFLIVSNAFSQSSQSSKNAAPPTSAAPKGTAPTRWGANNVPRQAQLYYLSLWGIDSLKVKYTESGEMIRFTYRVVEPTKAAQLNDGKAEPFLYDPQAGVKLVVPQMEKVGKLRQMSTPIAGRSYWMAFSNAGRRVRPGDRVSVEIGTFRAINLAVE